MYSLLIIIGVIAFILSVYFHRKSVGEKNPKNEVEFVNWLNRIRFFGLISGAFYVVAGVTIAYAVNDWAGMLIVMVLYLLATENSNRAGN